MAWTGGSCTETCPASTCSRAEPTGSRADGQSALCTLTSKNAPAYCPAVAKMGRGSGLVSLACVLVAGCGSATLTRTDAAADGGHGGYGGALLGGAAGHGGAGGHGGADGRGGAGGLGDAPGAAGSPATAGSGGAGLQTQGSGGEAGHVVTATGGAAGMGSPNTGGTTDGAHGAARQRTVAAGRLTVEAVAAATYARAADAWPAGESASPAAPMLLVEPRWPASGPVDPGAAQIDGDREVGRRSRGFGARNQRGCHAVTCTAGPCTAMVDEGATVNLTSAPGSGAVLAAWTSGCSESAATCTVTLSADTAVGATSGRTRTSCS